MLYHGTNINLDLIKPQSVVNLREKKRVGADGVVYASASYEEALVHGISKALNLQEHASYGENQNKWTISLPVTKDELKASLPVYLYTLEDQDFRYEPELNEWVSDHAVLWKHREELTVAEALSHFSEIKYETRAEGLHQIEGNSRI